MGIEPTLLRKRAVRVRLLSTPTEQHSAPECCDPNLQNISNRNQVTLDSVPARTPYANLRFANNWVGFANYRANLSNFEQFWAILTANNWVGFANKNPGGNTELEPTHLTLDYSSVKCDKIVTSRRMDLKTVREPQTCENLFVFEKRTHSTALYRTGQIQTRDANIGD